jgi:hypothetical protein
MWICHWQVAGDEGHGLTETYKGGDRAFDECRFESLLFRFGQVLPGLFKADFRRSLDAFEVCCKSARLLAIWRIVCNRGQSRERVSTFVLCLAVERVPKFAQCDLRNGEICD